MMTRKNFNALAAALKRAHDDSDPSHTDQWRACVNAVADVCEDDNPGFDRARFYGACEGEAWWL